MEKFNEAVRLAPKNAEALNGLGWTLLNSDKPQDAERVFQKAVSLMPDGPAILNGLGQTYLREKRYADAEPYLLKAAPNAPAAWFGLARLYLIQGKFSDAEEWAQKIVDSGQGDDIGRQMLQAARAKKMPDGLRLILDPQSAATNDAARYRTIKVKYEADYAEESALLDKLKGLSNDDLKWALPTAVPDGILSQLLQDLLSTEARLSTLRSQYGDQNPEVQSTLKLKDALNRQIDTRVTGILKSLEVRVASLKEVVQNADAKAGESAPAKDASTTK